MIRLQFNKPLTKVKIRVANEDDIPRIQLIVRQGFNALQNRGYSTKAIEAAIPSQNSIHQRLHFPNTIVLVATYKGQIIGTVSGTDRFKHLHIQSLAVDPKFQKLGVGHRLVMELEKRGQKSNCNKLFVQTAWAMFEAINLYRRLAFKQEGYHPRQFFGEDLISFGKLLNQSSKSKNGLVKS